MIWVALLLWAVLSIAFALAPIGFVLTARWVTQRIRGDQP